MKVNYIIYPLVLISIVYLIFSFILWELLPSQWTEFTRFTFSLLACACIVLGILIAKNIEYQNEEE
jgi:hypothetical protein